MKVLRTHKFVVLIWGISYNNFNNTNKQIFGFGCLTITLKGMEQTINEHKLPLMHKDVQQLNNLNTILF
jgi:hypothetical protein